VDSQPTRNSYSEPAPGSFRKVSPPVSKHPTSQHLGSTPERISLYPMALQRPPEKSMGPYGHLQPTSRSRHSRWHQGKRASLLQQGPVLLPPGHRGLACSPHLRAPHRPQTSTHAGTCRQHPRCLLTHRHVLLTRRPSTQHLLTAHEFYKLNSL